MKDVVPTISVIIPAHNEAKYVGRAVRSLIAQSLPRSEFEIIVVNDASTDLTLQALEPFAGGLRILTNKKQLGLPGSLNNGIRVARGRYVIRLDADDYVHAEYLNVLKLHLDMNPDYDAVACDYLLVDDHEEIIEHVNCFEKPIGCGILFHIEHLIDIGLYDEAFLAREDEDLRIRFLEQYQINRVALPLYRYRRHASNMTSDAKHMNYYANVLDQKHEQSGAQK